MEIHTSAKRLLNSPKKTRLLSSIVVCMCISYGLPGEWVSVDTVFTFSTSTSIDQARLETLSICRKIAIQKVIPTSMEVYSHFYRSQVEVNDYYKDETSLASFVISTNSGLIIDEKIVKGKPVVRDNSSSFDYEMMIKAYVEPVTGERDPSISLKLWADEDNLKSGDELVLHAESSIDGYLYLFWFYADNNVAMLFPNEYFNNNTILHEQITQIPSETEKKSGIAYRVICLPDRKITIETIYAVLTRQKIADQEALMFIGTDTASETAGERSFSDFQKWLSRIPLSLRNETVIQILIQNTN